MFSSGALTQLAGSITKGSGGTSVTNQYRVISKLRNIIKINPLPISTEG